MIFEELSRRHARAEFDCGVECLNTYLSNTARQHGAGGGSKTFVLLEGKGKTEIMGYFTMTVCEVDLENFPADEVSKYSKARNPYALLLARLAVDKKFQGSGYGGVILVEAFKRTRFILGMVGGWGLFVDAKDETAMEFYKHYGFEEISKNSKNLFISAYTLSQII